MRRIEGILKPVNTQNYPKNRQELHLNNMQNQQPINIPSNKPQTSQGSILNNQQNIPQLNPQISQGITQNNQQNQQPINPSINQQPINQPQLNPQISQNQEMLDETRFAGQAQREPLAPKYHPNQLFEFANNAILGYDPAKRQEFFRDTVNYNKDRPEVLNNYFDYLSNSRNPQYEGFAQELQSEIDGVQAEDFDNEESYEDEYKRKALEDSLSKNLNDALTKDFRNVLIFGAPFEDELNTWDNVKELFQDYISAFPDKFDSNYPIEDLIDTVSRFKPKDSENNLFRDLYKYSLTPLNKALAGRLDPSWVKYLNHYFEIDPESNKLSLKPNYISGKYNDPVLELKEEKLILNIMRDILSKKYKGLFEGQKKEQQVNNNEEIKEEKIPTTNKTAHQYVSPKKYAKDIVSDLNNIVTQNGHYEGDINREPQDWDKEELKRFVNSKNFLSLVHAIQQETGEKDFEKVMTIAKDMLTEGSIPLFNQDLTFKNQDIYDYLIESAIAEYNENPFVLQEKIDATDIAVKPKDNSPDKVNPIYDKYIKTKQEENAVMEPLKELMQDDVQFQDLLQDNLKELDGARSLNDIIRRDLNEMPWFLRDYIQSKKHDRDYINEATKSFFTDFTESPRALKNTFESPEFKELTNKIFEQVEEHPMVDEHIGNIQDEIQDLALEEIKPEVNINEVSEDIVPTAPTQDNIESSQSTPADYIEYVGDKALEAAKYAGAYVLSDVGETFGTIVQDLNNIKDAIPEALSGVFSSSIGALNNAVNKVTSSIQNLANNVVYSGSKTAEQLKDSTLDFASDVSNRGNMAAQSIEKTINNIGEGMKEIGAVVGTIGSNLNKEAQKSFDNVGSNAAKSIEVIGGALENIKNTADASYKAISPYLNPALATAGVAGGYIGEKLLNVGSKIIDEMYNSVQKIPEHLAKENKKVQDLADKAAWLSGYAPASLPVMKDLFDKALEIVKNVDYAGIADGIQNADYAGMAQNTKATFENFTDIVRGLIKDYVQDANLSEKDTKEVIEGLNEVLDVIVESDEAKEVFEDAIKAQDIEPKEEIKDIASVEPTVYEPVEELIEVKDLIPEETKEIIQEIKNNKEEKLLKSVEGRMNNLMKTSWVNTNGFNDRVKKLNNDIRELNIALDKNIGNELQKELLKKTKAFYDERDQLFKDAIDTKDPVKLQENINNWLEYNGYEPINTSDKKLERSVDIGRITKEEAQNIKNINFANALESKINEIKFGIPEDVISSFENGSKISEASVMLPVIKDMIGSKKMDKTSSTAIKKMVERLAEIDPNNLTKDELKEIKDYIQLTKGNIIDDPYLNEKYELEPTLKELPALTKKYGLLSLLDSVKDKDKQAFFDKFKDSLSDVQKQSLEKNIDVLKNDAINSDDIEADLYQREAVYDLIKNIPELFAPEVLKEIDELKEQISVIKNSLQAEKDYRSELERAEKESLASMQSTDALQSKKDLENNELEGIQKSFEDDGVQKALQPKTINVPSDYKYKDYIETAHKLLYPSRGDETSIEDFKDEYRKRISAYNIHSRNILVGDKYMGTNFKGTVTENRSAGRGDLKFRESSTIPAFTFDGVQVPSITFSYFSGAGTSQDASTYRYGDKNKKEYMGHQYSPLTADNYEDMQKFQTHDEKDYIKSITSYGVNKEFASDVTAKARNYDPLMPAVQTTKHLLQEISQLKPLCEGLSNDSLYSQCIEEFNKAKKIAKELTPEALTNIGTQNNMGKTVEQLYNVRENIFSIVEKRQEELINKINTLNEKISNIDASNTEARDKLIKERDILGQQLLKTSNEGTYFDNKNGYFIFVPEGSNNIELEQNYNIVKSKTFNGITKNSRGFFAFAYPKETFVGFPKGVRLGNIDFQGLDDDAKIEVGTDLEQNSEHWKDRKRQKDEEYKKARDKNIMLGKKEAKQRASKNNWLKDVLAAIGVVITMI